MSMLTNAVSSVDLMYIYMRSVKQVERLQDEEFQEAQHRCGG